MEHYFIRICNGSTCDQDLAISYVDSLLTSCFTHPCLPAPILGNPTSFVAVIDTRLEEPVDWIETEVPSSHFACGNVGPDGAANATQAGEVKNLDQFLSTHLHKLADHLPANGSYKLDIIIDQAVLAGMSVRKDLKFLGALYRVFRWHSAVTSILPSPDIQDLAMLREWCSLVDAQVLDSGNPSLLGGALAWRGSIKFGNDATHPGFQLRVDPLESELTNENEALAQPPPQEHLVLSPTLQVEQECDFFSIPPYLILPVAFRLTTCEPNIFNKTSQKLLDLINQDRNGLTLVVRLYFTVRHERPKPDKALTTSKWKKMLSSGKIKNPDIIPPTERFLSLAITRSPKSGQVVAHPLRAASQLVAQNISSHWPPAATIMTPLLNLPGISLTSFQALVNKINVLPQTCAGDHSSANCCLSAYLEHLTLTASGRALEFQSKDVHVSKEDVDPFEWPERVLLFRKQLEADNEKINAPTNLLLSPQLNTALTFNCKEADKYFLPNGEARNSEPSEAILKVTDSVKQSKEDAVVNTGWPEALSLKYHDIYYNRSSGVEEKERVGNEMARCYVQHETTCDLQQCPPKYLSRPPTWKSPATPKGVARLKQKLRRSLSNSSIEESEGRRRSPRKRINDPLSTTRTTNPVKRTPSDSSRSTELRASSSSTGRAVQKAPSRRSPRKRNSEESSQPAQRLANPVKRIHSDSGSTELKRSSLEKTERAVRKSLLQRAPSRSSPRKRSSAENSQPAQRNPEKRKSNSDPQELPEIMRKKLRVAVASALEKHGVNLKDNLFRPCGKKLFAICQTFVQDLPQQKGSVSQLMQKVAESHVKQVIEFEQLKLNV